MGTVPKALEGELVVAGWPSCLAAVAGEAINGWLPRTADSFEKIDKIGQGACSIVYKARDTTNGKVVALKKVRFDNLDPETVKFMAREILILRRLDHPNIIKLEGLITSRMSCSLYLVFEYMEHDLMGLTSLPGIKFSEPQVKCYMQQLLSGLEHCHSRGILHRDIKVSNLLIDNHGILKIADFGSASFFNQQQSQPLTSRVVTLWYRPPELLLGATHYGVSVDLWSTGCILGELYAGKAIMPGRTEVEQLHKIFKLCGSPSEDYWRESKLPHSTIFKPQQSYKRCLVETFKDFPMAALGLMEILLSIYPAHRGTTTSALKSEFFTTNPLACDPSTLPKYPPSKEIDAKVRDEEAGRVFKSTGVVKKRVNRSRQVRNDPIEKKKENTDVVANHPSMGMVPNTIEGEQVAAGWPSWLAAVAGEAINGWLPRKADSFEKLDEIGQGTYSSVYKARDLTNKKFVALKRVRFDNLYLKSVKFMAREIIILRRLDHPNIIKLEGLITSRTSCSLDLVFDYMEHDLTGLASLPGVKFSEPQIKCYMQQLLSGLEHCHSHGILHRDIKGSNLLVDNHGILKIADFGLASFFDHQQSQPLTNRFVTLCYQPPEILLGATHYGVSVDLWSTGCILGELYAGKAIMPGRTE